MAARNVAVLFLFLGVASCADVVGPETALQLSIEASPRVVAVGASVSFIATAYNPTNKTINLDSGCGYSLDVILTGPKGDRISVYEHELDGAVPTCQHMSWHEADPGERIDLSFSWQVPSTPGTYRAVTEIRCRGDQCPSSEAIEITVQ
jgi:hypothetical protein